jgi:hypothetical protein
MSFKYTFDDPDLLSVGSMIVQNAPIRTVQHIFQEDVADEDLEGFVESLYWFILRRLPNEPEVSDWCDRIRDGTSLRDAIISFLECEEAKNCAPNIDYAT